MKKTLIITMEFPPQIGGIATYIHNLADALDPDQVTVLAPESINSKEWDSQQKYKIVRSKLLYPKIVWPRWLKMYFLAKKIAKQEKIELVMVHHVLPVGYVAKMLLWSLKIPYLIFSHGTDLVTATATKWKKKRLIKVSKKAAQLIFNSESLKRRFLEKMPEFTDKSLVMYPCPEQEFLRKPDPAMIDKMREQYALSGKQIVLSVSRLDDGKGFPHLVRFMPEVLKKAPHLVWFIVGDGPKKNQILAEIQKHNLQNVVRFIGEVPHQDLPKYYYLADLFVLLTHPDNGREEGLGLVFLEAGAAGLPIVAGRSGGVEEAVLHGQTGLVVDVYKSGNAVADAIAKLLNNREEAKKLGSAGRARIEAEFNWSRQISKLSPWLQ